MKKKDGIRRIVSIWNNKFSNFILFLLNIRMCLFYIMTENIILLSYNSNENLNKTKNYLHYSGKMHIATRNNSYCPGTVGKTAREYNDIFFYFGTLLYCCLFFFYLFSNMALYFTGSVWTARSRNNIPTAHAESIIHEATITSEILQNPPASNIISQGTQIIAFDYYLKR